MPQTYTHNFESPLFKGSVTINTGLFINGQWIDPVDGGDRIDVVDPSTGKLITAISGGTSKDVDVAVAAAEKAYKTSWGLKVPGAQRAKLLLKLADLVEQYLDELAALECLNVGKQWFTARMLEGPMSAEMLRYYAGYADKIQGKTIETTPQKTAYTRHEPYGVCGGITAWNFPLPLLALKIAPMLAAGNVVVLKPSEITPLSALFVANLINEAGFPPGVVNIVTGYGNTVGEAISRHPLIRMISFTGSTLTGRKLLKASAETNLKKVTLELGGKGPTIIFDDANLEQAIKWASMAIFFNMGQVCVAGSRIYVQEGIYDMVLAGMTKAAETLTAATGGPFEPGVQHGPLVSNVQFERVMGYINSGKSEGAKVHIGGERYGDSGYFVKPTIFTGVRADMKIMREEIFGPVCSLVKFKTEEEVIEWANDTTYGLAASVMTENVSRSIRMANSLESGSVFINSSPLGDVGVPSGGYKQSGIGRENGDMGIEECTQIKAVHINIDQKI